MNFRVLLLLALTMAALSSIGYAELTNKPTGQQVLVVFSADSKDSQAVARYYGSKRRVPAENFCPVSGLRDSPESISREDFEKKISKRVTSCLEKVGKDKILYLVLTYGFPFRLTNMPSGYGEALDQYLAQPFDSRQGSRTENPYVTLNNPGTGKYGLFQSLADFRAAHPSSFLYSVWRLDGANAKAAKALVNRAIATEMKGATGIACFDRKYGPLQQVQPAGGGIGDWSLYRAAEFAKRAGFEVLEDDYAEEFGTSPAPKRCSDAFLYAGWYSYNNYNDAFDWAEGAIGIHLDSASCLNPRSGKNWCANALARGITVTAGAVGEPYLEGLPRPDGIVLNLLQGANVGDAFLRNTAWLRWMIINVGDPLYTPFPGGRGVFSGK